MKDKIATIVFIVIAVAIVTALEVCCKSQVGVQGTTEPPKLRKRVRFSPDLPVNYGAFNL